MSKKSSPTGGKMRLLGFLKSLLEDEAYSRIIIWTDKFNGEFQLKKPHEVAKAWGDATGNTSMNYDKMSRGLRFLYTSKTLEKLPGKDSRYRFLEPSSNSNSTPLPIMDFSNFDFSFMDVKPPAPRVGFNIDNLLSEESTTSSLQSSPTSTYSSSSMSTASPKSSTSSEDSTIQPLPHLPQYFSLMMPLLHQQFNAFKTVFPAVDNFPLQNQVQVFSQMYPTLFPLNQ
uniref:ETS domain-containing protein n=1 Tax=Caenorhabditis japonica TaxID=281687 RepID=A0A8R1DNV1_CAEJA